MLEGTFVRVSSECCVLMLFVACLYAVRLLCVVMRIVVACCMLYIMVCIVCCLLCDVVDACCKLIKTCLCDE